MNAREKLRPSAAGNRLEQIWSQGELSEAYLAEPFVRPMTGDIVATRDVYAICVSDRIEPSVTAHVEHDKESMTIHPAHDGAGVRVLFDFGREVIGFQEFE